MLDLTGSIITIDAMGCQTEIAERIIENEADYVLAAKGNQGSLYEEIVESFEKVGGNKLAAKYTQEEKKHGRQEKRTAYVLDAKEWLSTPVYSNWSNLTTLVKVESEVQFVNGKKTGTVTREQRYYISSLTVDPAQHAIVIRSHWGIENKLHWVLDVAFREDESRIRKANGPQNMALLRHIALNKLKNEKTFKRGIKAKRKKAGWNDDYLIKVLVT